MRQAVFGVTGRDFTGALIPEDSLERKARMRGRRTKEMRPKVSSHLKELQLH